MSNFDKQAFLAALEDDEFAEAVARAIVRCSSIVLEANTWSDTLKVELRMGGESIGDSVTVSLSPSTTGNY